MTLPVTPHFRLDGRRALVTGRGKGLACAAALAGAGAAVTLVARISSEIEDGAARIREAGGIADGATLDLRDLDAVGRFFRDRAAFHILVNNAGTNRPKPLAEISELDFDAVLQLNLKSLFLGRKTASRRCPASGLPDPLSISDPRWDMSAVRGARFTARRNGRRGSQQSHRA